MGVFRLARRAIERFNRWFELSAFASSVDSGGSFGPGAGPPSGPNPVGAATILGELDKPAEPGTKPNRDD